MSQDRRVTAAGASGDYQHAPWHRASTRSRLLVALIAGIAVSAPTAALEPLSFAPAVGWDAAALVFLVWTWASVWPQQASGTATLALREDPGRGFADAVFLAASVASLLAVGLLIVGSQQAEAEARLARVVLGIASVAFSWLVVHTVYCLKYASLYYGDPEGGIDFNSHERPSFRDFAYVAFAVGMTFQVSDTNLQSRSFRVTVLGHAILAFIFGAVILAGAINLVAGLSK